MALAADARVTPPATRAAGGRFEQVDALRALAALLVLWFHALIRAGAVDSPFAAVTARLDVGVAIFFAISGFLLYRPFAVARLADTPGPRTVAYAWRRVLRIAPGYWVALAVSAVLLRMGDLLEPGPLLTHALLLQAFDPARLFGGLPQGWTLTVEVCFYAFLPLFALVMRRLPGGARAEWAALGVLAVVAVAWKAAFLLTAADPSHANAAIELLWLPAFLDWFAAGMALAVATVVAPAALARIPTGVAWGAALGAFLLMCYGLGPSGISLFGASTTAAQALGRHVLSAVVAVGLLLPAVSARARRGAISRVLGNPRVLWLGVVSYGIYLWHVLALELIDRSDVVERTGADPYAVYLLGGTALSVLAGWISWRLVERRALALKRLVPDRTAPPRDVVNASDRQSAAASSTSPASATQWAPSSDGA